MTRVPSFRTGLVMAALLFTAPMATAQVHPHRCLDDGCATQALFDVPDQPGGSASPAAVP